MKIEKSSFYESLPVNSPIKKSFYKEDLTKEAVDFSSDLADEASSQNFTFQEEKKKDDSGVLEESEDKKFVTISSKDDEKEKEKLNVIA